MESKYLGGGTAWHPAFLIHYRGGGGGEAGKNIDKFIHFWSIGSLRGKKEKKKNHHFLGMCQEPAKPPPPLVSEASLQHTKLQQKLLCQTLAQFRCLPMKQAQEHRYWAQRLLTGLKRLKGKDTSWPRLGWPAALLRAGSLQPASLGRPPGPHSHISGCPVPPVLLLCFILFPPSKRARG